MNSLKMTDIITTSNAEKGFYPTPAALVDKLITGAELLKVKTILEPSAGKGNIIDRIVEIGMNELKKYSSCRNDFRVNVDCIEIDPYLRAILTYEYGGPHRSKIRDRLCELNNKRKYDADTDSYGELTPEEKDEETYLENEQRKRDALKTHIVHDDFLTFESRKEYDLIIMNPPFSDGDAHLLRAIELQSRHGGMIRCILNAETIRNTYSNRRKLLVRKLDELGAEVSFEAGAFADGERSTMVEVALIKIDIPTPQTESNIYKGLRKAANIEPEPEEDAADLTVTDFIERIVSLFNLEVDAGMELIKEYKAMQKYCGLNLVLSVENEPNLDPNAFLRLTRIKYWSKFFDKKEIMGKLTSNLQDKYRGMVDGMADYDFTLFNIQTIMTQMYAEMNQGIQDTIIDLFDRMTQKHSWYPECEKNIHYFNGWKTNKAHKVANKVILPVYGIFASYSWAKEAFNVYEAEKTISDIEKVFEYLDGNMTAHVGLHGVLERACHEGRTKNIQCKFFDVTLYKKGTMHIKFTNQYLLDRFNIYCCGKKRWLPPCYGHVSYKEMSREEQAVVDGFNGDGTVGSGEKKYTDILEHCSYFFGEPKNHIALLGREEDA